MTDFRINTKKNLLAFSGGVDSTALFFLLLEQNIPFDIAIVDYNVRAQSKEEVTYAKELANKYNKHCFIKSVTLDSHSNFEKKARDIRYDFFEELIKEKEYETLITAHQFDDSFEWFLMQLSKGSGLVELLGLKELDHKEFYTLYRPLLSTTKDELQEYLQNNHIQYFIDASNSDKKYKRNKIREEFSSEFLKEYKSGLLKSFEYLKNDEKSLNINYDTKIKQKEFERFEALNSDNLNIRIIDKSLKKRGILLSKKQRDEILNLKEVVVSHKISISLTDKYIWIAPHCKVIMDKKFKDSCRVLKVPKNVRSYLFSIDFDLSSLTI